MKIAGWIAIVLAALLIGNAAWAAINNQTALQSSLNFINHTPCRSEDVACSIAPEMGNLPREAIQGSIGVVFLIAGLALADVKIRKRDPHSDDPITLL